jgi:hypothetical protein
MILGQSRFFLFGFERPTRSLLRLLSPHLKREAGVKEVFDNQGKQEIPKKNAEGFKETCFIAERLWNMVKLRRAYRGCLGTKRR